MNRLVLASSTALLIAFAATHHSVVLGQGGGNPFIGHSDTGDTVHILPPPAAIRSPHDTQPTDATRSNKLQVYPASYGSGNLRDHGGHEISNAGFFAVYWNNTVASSAGTQGNATLRSTVQNFITDFADGVSYSQADKSADYTIVQQYGSRDPIAAELVFVGDYVDSKATQSSISDSSIRSYLASLFNAGIITPDAYTLYGTYFPSGMKVTMRGGASCSSFCGYHGHFTYNNIDVKYAVFPYTNCSGCSLSGKTVADMLTIVTSHEVREAVTDEDLNAWYDASGYEADDKCAWHNLYQMTTGSFWVQPEYSNGSTSPYPGPGCVVPNK